MITHKALWQVSLSDGSTFQEGKSPFEEIENELSPWNRLLEYLTQSKLTITSINLFTHEGQTFNLPSVGKNPNFKPFRDSEKPVFFRMFRIAAREVNQEDLALEGTALELKDWFSVIEAEYANKQKLQLWVDETNPKNCWTLLTI